MSKQVDERVVSMQFDNKHFESNVQTTMSTLDKLKQKLNFKGATKGMENIGAAAKNVNMSGLGSAVENVRLKFSALEVMGVTALANITNSAVNAGKRIVSALTIDPIKTGFDEYETKINSIQTIMSNTASKGTTMEDVTRVIDELNTYADKTIYNFAEMTRNIGTFTAAGVGLEESAAAIQGIANLAAASGSNSQQASTAMYQLSQALAAGTVKLMDWNSVVNAGMGGEKFQEALKSTAREMGISVDSIIEKNGSFRDSLQDGWLTAEVLNTTLRKFTKEGAKEYAESMVASGKYTQEQADALLKEAQAMEDAATKVKTFTQLWDTLKESAQSGWSKTWELIFGDFEEAKELFTSLSDFLGGFINKMSDFRNNLIEGALGNGLQKIFDKINGSSLGKTAKAVSNVTKSLGYYQEMVNKIWRGDYNNNPVRADLLTKEGHNAKVLQDLVNKGYQYKLTVEDVAESEKKFGVALEETSEEAEKTSKTIESLTDEQLKNLGLTEDEIREYRALEEQSKKTGKSIEELLKEMEETDGRTLLIESLKNAGSGLVSVFSAIGKAWKEVFPPMTSVQLYNIIKAINEFSKKLVVSDETADKLRRTLKGVFAILDIITTVVGGAFKIAFKVVSQLLGYFDMDVLSLTASIGDAIVKFRDWIDSTLDFTAVFDKIVPYIKRAIEAVGDWVDGLKETDNIPKYILEGLINGLREGITLVGSMMWELGTIILEKIKAVLGIHSPSTEFFKIGKNIIDGLINGLKAGASAVWEFIKGIGEKCIDIITSIDFGAILAAGLGVGMLAAVMKLTNVLDKFAAPFEGLGSMFEGLGDMFEGLGKNFKAAALEKKSKALLNLAIAIGILTASVFVLTKLDTGKMWGAIGALAALAAIIVALSVASAKLNKTEGFSFNAMSIVAMGASLLFMAFTLKQLASIDVEDIPKTLVLLAGMIAGLCVIMKSLGKLDKFKDIKKVGSMLMKVSVALLILVGVIKLASGLELGEILKGLAVITAFELLVSALIYVSKFAGEHASKAGSMILKVSVALLIMTSVMKIASSFELGEIGKGLAVMAAFELLVAGLIAVSKLAGANASKAGTMMLMVSLAMLVMARVVKQVSELKGEDLSKGLGIIALLGGIFTALIAVSKLAGDNAAKAGAMLLMMSGALLILSGVIFILSKLDPSGLGRATAVVTLLGGVFAGLIAVTKIAKDTKGLKSTLIILTVAISLLTVAIAALSFIDSEKLAASTAALTAVIGTFALLVTVTKFAKNTKSMRKSLTQMLGVIVVLAAVIAALSFVKPEAALGSAAALSLLLTSFAAALFILGTAGRISTTVSKQIGPMLAVVAGLAVILGVMSALNVEGSLQTALSLSVLLNAMATALVILSYAGKTSMASIGALALMGLVVAELAVILGIMSALEIEPSIETAIALSLLLNAMAAACWIVSGIPAAAAAQGALGLAAFVGIMAGLLVVIGGFSQIPGFNELIADGGETLASIGYALGNFVGSIIGGFSAGATSGLPAIGTNLSEFMSNVQPFIEGATSFDTSAMEGVKALAEVILILTAANILDGLTSWLTGENSFSSFADQLPILGTGLKGFSDATAGINPEQVTAAANAAKALAEMTSIIPNEGGVVSWFTGENSISKFASELPILGAGLKGFSDSVAGISPEEVTAAANAAKVLADMTSAIPNEGGVVSWFTGENSISKFASQLPTLGMGLKGFSDAVAGINPEEVTAAANAAKTLADMTSAIPNEGGVVSWFTGENSISKFGTDLLTLGAGLKGFSDAVTGVVPEEITAAANAARTLAEMTHAIPNEGGMVSWFTGENSLSKFSTDLITLGIGLKGFSDSVAGIVPEEITAAANAARTLAEMTNAIPNEGGVVSWFTGENSLSKFGTDLITLGTGLKGFSESVAGIVPENVVAAADAAKSIASMSNTIPKEGGIVAWFTGESSISKFGDQLPKLGDGLKGFSDSVAGIIPENVTAAANAAKTLAQMTNTVPKNTGNLATFGTNLKTFGGHLGSYFAETANISAGAISTSTQAIESIKTAAAIDGGSLTKTSDAMKGIVTSLKDLANMGDAVSKFSKTLEKLGETSVNAFMEAFEDMDSDMKKAGKEAMEAFIKGVKDCESKAKKACTAIVTKCSNAISDKSSTFKKAGASLVEGFANGISANTYMATAKAKAMAAAAAEAAKKELDINSPSKVFRAIGTSVPEGFAMGIDKLKGLVTDSASSMGDTAMDGLKSSISRITDVINSDIDSQPTIRPVLDLSDVRSGANAISGLFRNGASVGVMANVNSISSMMNSRSQNGTNSDVISAIKDLKDTIGSNAGNVYNVNGVTYDDGSNVADAVKSLVRAAKVERRR